MCIRDSPNVGAPAFQGWASALASRASGSPVARALRARKPCARQAQKCPTKRRAPRDGGARRA
eukprot:7679797-Alexandrium_andersonii.AAC.1